MYAVLVIDDDEVVCRSIRAKIDRLQLSGIGCILQSSSAEEAERLMLKEKPHIVLMDVSMPYKSGHELIRSVSQSLTQTQFIMLSGHDNFQYVRNAFKLGVLDYLLKPVRFGKLEDVLKSAIGVLQANLDPSGCPQLQEEPVVEQAKQLAEQYWDQQIDMTFIANRLNMNYSYFSKLFKEKTGMNFSRYLLRLRMEKGKALLADPHIKIQAISEKLGYQNPKNFTRTFKEFTGLSPQDFRKMSAEIARSTIDPRRKEP